MMKMKGFSLIEIVIVLGLVSIVSFFAISISIPQVRGSETSSVASDLRSELFLYQQNAYSGKNEKSYGVKFFNDRYVMFVGDSYAAAESTTVRDLRGNIEISQINLSDGSDEIVFSAGSFRPSADGEVHFSDEFNTYVLEVNSEGLIHTCKL